MKNKLSLIITIITLSIFLFVTVGYAIYGQELGIRGNVKFAGNGEVGITNVELVNSSNITNPENPEFTKDSINFNLNFTVESDSNLDDEYVAEYEITMSNMSFYDYEFLSAMFTPSIETTNNENLDVSYDVVDIEPGDIIPKLTTKTFKLIIYMYPKTTGDYNVSGGSSVQTQGEEEEQTGSLLGSISKNITLDLKNPKVRDKVSVNVINSYDSPKEFSFNLSNSNFKLVDSNGNNLSTFTIPANTTQSYDIYIERKNVSFATDSQTTNLIFVTNDGNSSLGNIKILVTKDESLVDVDAPIISDVNAVFVASNGKVDLSWSATDVSGIDYFIIEAIDSDNKITTFTTTNNDTTFQTTGLSNGTYYFKVYGVDTKGYSGKTQATECKTSAGKCSQSTSATYTWVFNVTYSLGNNISKSSGPDTIAIGETLTAVFTVSGNRDFNTISASMNGRTLTRNSQYTWTENNNRGTMKIPNVTGPITINVTATSGGCLVEGSKIKLANGKTKNIEDITYTDLLSAWSYESGSLTYEYPIWIEKSREADSYEKTTFSDGSVLKTVELHQVFSLDENKFVNIYDGNGYIKVGTKVAKEVNGKIVPVTVTSVETVFEKVKYYYVASSIYYNIISDNIITTSDQIVPGVTLSNMYGFDKNIKWPSIRKEIINKPGSLFTYDDLKVMPYYLYLGSRGNETKIFVNLGYATTESLIDYLLNTQLDPTRAVKVNTNKKGNRMWMVTTNHDNVFNKEKYLHEEGSYYTLPKVLGVNKWFSTFENKYYLPGEKVKVDFPMHFISK